MVSFATEAEPCNHLFKEDTYDNLTQKNCVGCGEALPIPAAEQISLYKLQNAFSGRAITHMIFGKKSDYSAELATAAGIGVSFDMQSVRAYIVDSTMYVLSEDDSAMSINNLAFGFANNSSLVSIDFGNIVDISNVINAASALSNAERLEEIKGISNWRGESIVDMSHMFAFCTSLKSLDLSNLVAENCTDMTEMFRD